MTLTVDRSFRWVRSLLRFGLVYGLLATATVLLVDLVGVPTPAWPADSVAIALLAGVSGRDRIAGFVGTLLGFLAFSLARGEMVSFTLAYLVIRSAEIWVALVAIDQIRAWATRTSNAGLFEIVASAVVMVVSPAAGAAVGILLLAAGASLAGPITLYIWWGGATAASAIFVPVVLYMQNQRPQASARPAWLPASLFAAIVPVFTVGAVAVILTSSEPMVFIVVALLLASYFLRPADMAILSAATWFATVIAATFGIGETFRSPMLMPIGVGIGTLLPIATAVLIERLRQREHALAESENLFRRSMEDSNIGVTIIGADYRYHKVNAAFCAMTGYSEGELIGRRVDDITFPDDRMVTAGYCEGIHKGSVRSVRVEKRYVHKSGDAFWVDVASIVVADPVSGKPSCLISQVENIDVKKRSLAALAESESRWSFALENSQQGVWDVDKVAGRLYLSPTWKRMVGYQPDEFVVDGLDDWLRLMHPDDRDGFLALNDAHEEGKSDWIEAEFRLRHKDGHWVWILDRGKVVARDGDGNALRIIGTHTDVSHIKNAELAIQLLEERVRLSVEAGGIGLWSINLDTGSVEWNGQSFGTELAGAHDNATSWLKFVHPEDRDRVGALFRCASEDAATRVNTSCRLLSPTRGLIHIRVLADRVTLSNGECLLLGTAWDISDQVNGAQALRDEKERLKTTLHSIADGVISTDNDGRVVFMNPAAERMTGFTEAEGRGLPIDEVFQAIHEDSGLPAESCAKRVLATGQPMERHATQVIDVRCREPYSIREAAAPIHAGAGEPAGVVLVFQDVSAERSMQRSLAHAASHDDLTGLGNRRHFEAAIRATIGVARAEDSRHGLLFLDLDRFKIVNDTAGHLAGDALLQEVARIMRTIVPVSDCLARLGGDEFAVLLENCDRDFAAFVAEKLIAAIEAIRFTWDGKVYEIAASVGVSQVDATTASAEAVLAEADVACYAAKSAGRGRVSVFRQDTGEAQQHMSDFRMAARIRETIEAGRFVLYAQEIRAIADPDARGRSVELLIRMIGENGEVSAPDTFIPAAERFELMGTIDRWVLAKVVREFGPAIMAVPNLHVAVNLSANSLNDPSLWRYLVDLLHDSALTPSRLTLEITETAVINSFEVARNFIRAARSIGCRISLDDFGSGLSSFTYLKSFDVDAIKIDGSFVHNMPSSAYDRTVVRAINEIGRDLGVDVIAERIEDAATLQELAALGVRYGQGYLFDRPRDFAAVLADYGVDVGGRAEDVPTPRRA